MALGIPPLRVKILLESNPPKSRILVRRSAISVSVAGLGGSDSSRILVFRGGIPRPVGNFPESLSQAVLVVVGVVVVVVVVVVGIILVRRLAVSVSVAGLPPEAEQQQQSMIWTKMI